MIKGGLVMYLREGLKAKVGDEEDDNGCCGVFKMGKRGGSCLSGCLVLLVKTSRR